MKKEGSGRGKEMAPKLGKPAVLSAEAAAMEQKLAELRKAMEKERAKREALMSNTSGGSIWRNGGSNGGLRAGAKGKGPGEGAAPPGGGSSSSARRPGSGEAAASRGGSARSGSSAAQEVDIPSVSGSRLTAPRPTSSASAQSKGGSAVGGPAAASSGSRSGGGGGAATSSGSAAGGMSCGTDDNSSLAGGAFSEADSHRSFLEALNEWRKANRGDTGADAGTSAGASTSTGAQPRSSAAHPPVVESASLEVQTESRPASRPSSAKPLSYFDKLVINTTSRVAGHLASGGDLQSLRSSLSGQSTGLPRPTSTPRPPSAPQPSTPAPAAAGGITGPAKTGPALPGKQPGAASLAASSVPAPVAAAAKPGSAPAAADKSKSGALDPLGILDRLEALELQRQAAAEDEDEDEHPGAIHVSTAIGVVLTKNMRLPDEVIMAPNKGC